MSNRRFSRDELTLLRNLKASKRARVVIEHIIKHGSVTTDQLARLGYKHPPRAIGDVRDCGIPLVKQTVSTKNKRRIGKYTFGDLSLARLGMDGRRALPKSFKTALLKRDGSHCSICNANLDSRYLQIDHRVPYRIAGDIGGQPNPDDFMLICASCNRAKSWSCEHCQNWLAYKKPATCKTCYWASPRQYTHIAMAKIRRLDVVWQEKETEDYHRIKLAAKAAGAELPDFVKSALKCVVDRRD